MKTFKPITTASGERWSIVYHGRDAGYQLTVDGNSRGWFDRAQQATDAKDAAFVEEARRASVETVVTPTAAEDDAYEIVYLPGDGLYGLRFHGELVDRFYSYVDAEAFRVDHARRVEREIAMHGRCDCGAPSNATLVYPNGDTFRVCGRCYSAEDAAGDTTAPWSYLPDVLPTKKEAA